MSSALRSTSVFINCPFVDRYRPIFDAIVFSVRALGFVARCAREAEDSGEGRLSKIERIIEECRFGIHDISEVRLDPVFHLPRFNMPLELGLFFGCKRFGGRRQREKISLILDSEPFRYQKFISDIAGNDIRSHGGEPAHAISAVRDWLAVASPQREFLGGAALAERYCRFRTDLPEMCRETKLEPDTLTFRDFSNLISLWLRVGK